MWVCVCVGVCVGVDVCVFVCGWKRAAEGRARTQKHTNTPSALEEVHHSLVRGAVCYSDVRVLAFIAVKKEAVVSSL